MNKKNNINQIPQLLLRCENESLGEQYKYSIIRLLNTLKLNLIETKKYSKSKTVEEDESIFICGGGCSIELYLSNIFKNLSNTIPPIYSSSPYSSYLFKIVCDNISNMYKLTPQYLCQNNNSILFTRIYDILEEDKIENVELNGFYINPSNCEIEVLNLMNKGIIDFLMSKICILETVLSVTSQMLRIKLIKNKTVF